MCFSTGYVEGQAVVWYSVEVKGPKHHSERRGVSELGLSSSLSEIFWRNATIIYHMLHIREHLA